VLIHGLALVAAGTSVAVLFAFQPAAESFAAFFGMGLSATFVLGLWSLVLAIKSLRRKEASRWPVVVIVLCALEAVPLLPALAFSTVPWSSAGNIKEWALRTGIVVFVPVTLLAGLVAALVAWLRMRRLAKRDARAGVTGKRYSKRGLVWFLAVTVALVALLVPVPLFIYCAYMATQWEHPANRTWRSWVVEHTPVVIGETAASLLPSSPPPSGVTLYQFVLLSGRVSRGRLTAELKSPDPWTQSCALEGLFRADPKAALGLAGDIGDGKVTGQNMFMQHQAGSMIGEHGSPEQIRHFLNAATTQTPPPFNFVQGMLPMLGWKRPELLPDLVRFCKSDSSNRDEALRQLAYRVPPKDLPKLWAEFLADTDIIRRKQSVAAIAWMQDQNVRLQVLVAGLEGPDPALRQMIAQNLRHSNAYMYDMGSADPALRKRFAASLLPLLDSDDVDTRRGAAWSLVGALNDPRSLGRERQFLYALMSKLSGNKQVAETPKEVEVRGNIREAARKWLDGQK